MKKMLVLSIALAAIFGMVTMASAANTFTVNMCGASAQAGFWEASGAAVVQDLYGCDSTILDWESGNDKNLIIRGLLCDVENDGTADDTIYVRYLASNSITGCQEYTCGDLTYTDPTTCAWTGDGSCPDTVTDQCQLGCADVPCDSFNARTIGHADGCHASPYIPSVWNADSEEYAAGTEIFQGVVVPFGFIVNNAVTHHVCDYDNVYDQLETEGRDVHWAYNKDGWQCDPTDNAANDENLACRGDFKCVDGACTDGLGTACTTAADCKYTDVVPTCVEEPLDNLSLLQVCHIFSGAVDNWRDFGASYSDMPVTRCMRHAGSGTHQTFLDTVMARCGGLNALIATSMNKTCHYESSSDLSRDCVGDYAGGVGYVDADKVMFRSGFTSGSDKGGTGNRRRRRPPDQI